MAEVQIRYTSIGREQAIAGLNDFNKRLQLSQQLLLGTEKTQQQLGRSSNLSSLSQGAEAANQSFKSLAKEALTLQKAIEQVQREKLLIEVRLLDRGASLANLQSQIEKLSARKISIAARVDADTKQIAALDAQVKQLQSRRIQVKADFGEGSVQLTKLDAQIQRLEQRRITISANSAQADSAIAGIDAKLQALSAKQVAITGETTDIEADLLRVNGLLADLGGENANQALQSLQKVSQVDFGDVEQSVGRLNALFEGVGIAAGQQLFAGIQNSLTGVPAAALQSFTAFDSAVRQAGVISGSSAKEITVLREEARRLGIVTSKTPAEIASMTVELSRAGFTAEEQTAALEGIVRASEATGDSLQQVGDIIGKTIRTFGLNASESNKIADLLTATANNTNSSVLGLGESLAFVGPQASAANQPLEDTLILIGLLGDQGIQGSSAGTGLASALERLQVASAGAETEFSNLVRGSKRATEAFQVINADVRNTDGTMKSVLEILPVVQKNLEGLQQTDKDILFKALFGVQGGRTFQALLNTAPERIELVTDAVKNSTGVAGESGEALLKGLGGAINLFEGSLGATLGTIGSFLAKGVEPVVRGATLLLNTFLGLPGPIQTVVVGTATLATALAAATAVLAAYNSETGKRIVGDTLSALSAAKSTIATIAKDSAEKASLITTRALTVAFEANIIAMIAQAAAQTKAIAKTALETTTTAALTVAKNALALATGKATTAQIAQLAVLGKSTIALGLFAGAAAAVALVADTFNSVTEEAGNTRDSIDGINEALKEVDPESAEKVREGFGGVQGVLDKLIRGPLPGLATSAEAAATLSKAAFDDLILTVGDVGIAAAGIAGDLERGVLVDPAKVGQTVDAIDKSIAALKEQKVTSEEDVAQRDAQIAKLEGYRKKITEAAEGNGDLTEATGELTTTLEELGDELDRVNGFIDATVATAGANLAEQFAAGAISAEEYQTKLGNIERSGLEDRIDAAKKAQADLRQLQVTTTDPAKVKELGAQIFDLETQIGNDRKTLAEKTVKDREAAEQAAVKVVEDAAKARAAVIDKEVEQNRKSLEELGAALDIQVDLGTITEGQAGAQLALRSVNDELATLQKRLTSAQTAAAGFGAGTEEQASALQEVAGLQGDLAAARRAQAQAERDLIEANKQAQLDAIQEEVDARTAAVDTQLAIVENISEAQIAGQEQVVAAYDQGVDALDRQLARIQDVTELIDAQVELQKTLSEDQLNSLDRALEIREKLDSGSVESAKERRELEKEITDLGFRGQSAAQIRLQVIEEQAAAAERERQALILQQEIATQSLQIEIQKQKIADQRAITEAQIGIIQQQAANAALSADRERLAIQQESLRSQLALEDDPAARQQLELAIQSNEVAIQGADQQIAAGQALVQVRQQELQLAAQTAIQNQEALAREQEVLKIQQQNQRLQLANQQATEARAIASQAAGQGDFEAARAAEELSAAAAAAADQEERRARALLESSQNAQQLVSQIARSNQPQLQEGFTIATEAATEQVTIAADQVEQNLSDSALVWDDSAQTVEGAFLQAAEDWQGAINGIQATLSQVALTRGADIPGLRTGGALEPGKVYQLHQNEVVYSQAPGWVFNALEAKTMKRQAIQLMMEQMSGRFTNPDKALPSGSIQLLTQGNTAAQTSRLTSVTEAMAKDIRSLKGISQLQLEKSRQNSRAIQRLELQQRQTSPATMGSRAKPINPLFGM